MKPFTPGAGLTYLTNLVIRDMMAKSPTEEALVANLRTLKRAAEETEAPAGLVLHEAFLRVSLIFEQEKGKMR